ncbi:MAG: virulence factor [Alphaproteobacteria bacterium]|nr:virulence factor [Alphaproteobacteria bacterium]MDP6564469.1 virulence factor [Alphaproteobacteria bacterium]MDP6816308.1 virulence factor [Alphaproteobacteria bacterium]
MPTLTVIYWRDIPAQVIVRNGRSARRQLADRFQEAIDQAAMDTGAEGREDYLEDWRQHREEVADGTARAVADETAARLETDYDPARLAALVGNGGWEDDGQ